MVAASAVTMADGGSAMFRGRSPGRRNRRLPSRGSGVRDGWAIALAMATIGHEADGRSAQTRNRTPPEG